MEVSLYVYDLSRGMARQMSAAFLGVQIDAVYHTSIIYGGVEYFYGQGIQMSSPGNTHHGRPMEIVHLGETQLTEDIVHEYLESLKEVYSAETYDLFLHNCNNFSNDFAMFLVGKSIPSHITALPQTVMNTPFGQMLKPMLDSAMRPITQAPVVPPLNQSLPTNNGSGAVHAGHAKSGHVRYPKNLTELNKLLDDAKSSCAVVFFTSATCPPCKMVYPTYDSLAAEAGSKATLIKVDISQVYDIATKYAVRATPTFYTYLKGEKENEWAGADPGKLTGNVRLLIQMAFPPHPHEKLSLPAFSKIRPVPVLYNKVPPLDKLLSKLGESAAKEPSVASIAAYLRTRLAAGSREATLPNLSDLSLYLRKQIQSGNADSTFALVDLLRACLSDPRVSGYFAAENAHKTMIAVLANANDSHTSPRPYNLRLVTAQAACNLFSTPLYIPHLLQCEELTTQILSLITSGLLDTEKETIRAVSASLAFNLCSAIHVKRLNLDESTNDHSTTLPEHDQVALAASLVEALDREISLSSSKSSPTSTASASTNTDLIKLLLSSIGLLAYCRESESELSDLLTALEASTSIKKMIESGEKGWSKELTPLMKDVVKILDS